MPAITARPPAGKQHRTRMVTYAHDELVPRSFFETISTFRWDSVSKCEQPASKRAKRWHAPESAICICREHFTIRRSYADQKLLDLHFSREMAVELLKYEAVRASPKLDTITSGDHLIFATGPGMPSTVLKLAPNELPNRGCILSELVEASARSHEPGVLWSSPELSIVFQQDYVSFILKFELFWNETLPGDVRSIFHGIQGRRNLSRRACIISELFPLTIKNANKSLPDEWSPAEFYKSAFVPAQDDSEALSIQLPDVLTALYPYQKRTLQWLLSREGVHWSQARSAVVSLTTWPSATSDYFRRVQDADGEYFHINDVLSIATRDLTSFPPVRGGILAEEMGLGKTLEVIALITLHRAPFDDQSHSADPNNTIVTSRSTLIVTPEPLRHQWLAELAKHAPNLGVKFYSGYKDLDPDGDVDDTIADLCAHDVIVTTYRTLRAEFHSALNPPGRSMRNARKYARPQSPLVRIKWWRACLDEAQMIENGASRAAQLAKLIPRVNSWSVTGTPVKSDFRDLRGLLSFLKLEPYCSDTAIWRTFFSFNNSHLKRFSAMLALRHNKSIVRNEIRLPPQKRYLLLMPFSEVEEQHYQAMFKEMAQDCGMNLLGEPLSEEWELKAHADTMNIWLNRLRQTALHPEIGVQNRRALGREKTAAPLRTLDEVLEAMIEQNDQSLWSELRACLSTRLDKGHIMENGPRVREALATWEAVRDDIEPVVAESRMNWQAAMDNTKLTANDPATEKDEEISDELDQDKLATAGRVAETRRRLRVALDLQHRAVFCCANAFFQIRENPDLTDPKSAEYESLLKLETDSYDTAQKIRNEILQEGQRKTMKIMNTIKDRASKQDFVEISALICPPAQGIESRRIIDRLEVLYDALNVQADALDILRERAIRAVLKPLVDEAHDGEVTGEEFTDSTKIQDELMVLVQVLRAFVADRQDAMTGQTNELVRHEILISRQNALQDLGHAPQTLLKLLELRDKVKPDRSLGTIRIALGDARSLASRLTRAAETGDMRAGSECTFVNSITMQIRTQLIHQNKIVLSLDAELELLTAAMNSRLDYYRQLQALSDDVLPYEGPKDDRTMAKLEEKLEAHKRRLQSAESKQRYLLSLKESGTKSNEPRLCIICQSTFVLGVLTVCGHQYCKECMMLWFKTYPNCPTCKRPLKLSDLHEITLKPPELRICTDSAGAPSALERRGDVSSKIYSEFNAQDLADIRGQPLVGPTYTTKVDMLLRHLLWLRKTDPGAKSIIFSQYKDFLDILRDAFTQYRIGFSAVDQPNGITLFKESTTVKCLLMHARAHSSGLNFVNATHVFLCEPLLNAALELQATARVDRIGQQHETTVWLYMISGTVEESIYDLSVRRRMRHVEDIDAHGHGKSRDTEIGDASQQLDASIEEANTFELEHAALSKLMSQDRTLGEAVDQQDLWNCLFGTTKKAREADRSDLLDNRAVMGFLAAEAAEARRAPRSSTR